MDKLTGLQPIALCPDQDFRLPALFFDKLFPVAGRHDEVPSEIKADLHYLLTEDELEGLAKVTMEFLTKSASFEQMLHTAITQHEEKLGQNSNNLVAEFENMKMKHFELSINRLCNSAIMLYQQKCAKRSIPVVPVFLDVEAYEGYGEVGNKRCAELEIIAPLIKTQDLTWEHIIEVRRDPAFNHALRRFRLLFAEDYRGKDSAYIADSLNNKIQQYEDTCDKHGLELTTGAIRQIVDSKSLLGVLSIAAVGILTGSPSVVEVSAVAGGLIELSKLSLFIAEKRAEFTRQKREADVAYLMMLKDKKLTV